MIVYLIVVSQDPPVRCPPSLSRPGEQLGFRSRAPSASEVFHGDSLRGWRLSTHNLLTHLRPAIGKRLSVGRRKRGDDLYLNPTTPGCGEEDPAVPPAPPAHPVPIPELRGQKKSSPLQWVRSSRHRGRPGNGARCRGPGCSPVCSPGRNTVPGHRQRRAHRTPRLLALCARRPLGPRAQSSPLRATPTSAGGQWARSAGSGGRGGSESDNPASPLALRSFPASQSSLGCGVARIGNAF